MAEGKCVALWDQIKSSPVGPGAYPDVSKMTEFAKSMDYSSLLNYEEDTQPAGREKVLCSCDGAVAKVRFEWKQQARDIFTGMFSLAEHGIMRCSSINAPLQSSSWSPAPSMVPMLALKFFRDSEAPSANLVLAYKKSGQKEMNFFAHALSNHFTENVKFPFKSALKIFKKYSDFPTFSGLSEFASVGQGGELVQNPRAPYVLVLRPLDHHRKRQISSTGRLMDQFKDFSGGDILYDVYAVPEPLAVGASSSAKLDVCTASALSGCPVGPAVWNIGKLILESSFVTSQFGDEQLFFRHHLFDGDLRLRPDWRVKVDTMLGAPFYDEVINTGSVWNPDAEEPLASEPDRELLGQISEKVAKVEADALTELSRHDMCPVLSNADDDDLTIEKGDSLQAPLEANQQQIILNSGNADKIAASGDANSIKGKNSSVKANNALCMCPFLNGMCLETKNVVEELEELESEDVPTMVEVRAEKNENAVAEEPIHTTQIASAPEAVNPEGEDAILIFSRAGCPHCNRAMTMLEDLGWAYTIVSLSDHPEKRKDLLSLTNRLAVPQVFFNSQHVGGASELHDLIAHLSDPAAFYAQLLTQARPDDPRLKKPRTLRETSVREVAVFNPIICIGEDCLDYQAVVSKIISGVRVKDHKKRMGLRSYPQSFKGSELLDYLTSEYHLPGRQDAVQVFYQLQKSGVFHPVDYDAKAIDEGNRLYRFQAHEVGLWSALNVERLWLQEGGVNSPMQVLRQLVDQFSGLKMAHTDKNGLTDYLAIQSDSKFSVFTSGVCALQGIDLSALDLSTRKAFVINMYNMLVDHGVTITGQPTTDLQRAAFFNGVRYKLGGSTFSLHDLENGILRGNRQPPYHLQRPFSAGDSRSSTVLPLDHRIHFALNCSARSCPVVKSYTAENIEEELSLASIGWVGEDDNVRVDLPNRILFVSKIMKWFACDFGKNNEEIATTLRTHAVGDKKSQLESLLGSKFKLKHLPYDWSAPVAASHVFTERCYSCFVTN